LIETAKHEHPKIKFKFLKHFQTVGTDSDNFWANIDYLLVLSRADNSPNVIHEAKSKGVPVISSMVGGIGELLNSEKDIIISPKEFNEEDILRVIVDLSLSAIKYKHRGLDPNYIRYTQNCLQDMKALYESFFIENS
jgi:glycosyltransferase involved in cell wall biosynthesis